MQIERIPARSLSTAVDRGTAIKLVSGLVPLARNLSLALLLDQERKLIFSPENLLRLNVISGALLLCVAAAILLTSPLNSVSMT